MAFCLDSQKFNGILQCSRKDCSKSFLKEEHVPFMASTFEIFCYEHKPPSDASEHKEWLKFLIQLQKTLTQLNCEHCGKKSNSDGSFTDVFKKEKGTKTQYLCKECAMNKTAKDASPPCRAEFMDVWIQALTKVLTRDPRRAPEAHPVELLDQLKRTFEVFLQLFRELKDALLMSYVEGSEREDSIFHRDYKKKERKWKRMFPILNNLMAHLEIIMMVWENAQSRTEHANLFMSCLADIRYMYDDCLKVVESFHISHSNNNSSFILSTMPCKLFSFPLRLIDEDRDLKLSTLFDRELCDTPLAVQHDCDDALSIVDVTAENKIISAKWISVQRGCENPSTFCNNKSESMKISEHFGETNPWPNLKELLDDLHPLAMVELLANYWVITSAEDIHLVYLNEQAMIFSKQLLHTGRYGQGLCVYPSMKDEDQSSRRGVAYALCNGNELSQFDFRFEGSAYIRHTVRILDVDGDFFRNYDTLGAFNDKDTITHHGKAEDDKDANGLLFFVCRRWPSGIVGQVEGVRVPDFIYIFNSDGTLRYKYANQPFSLICNWVRSPVIFGVGTMGTVVFADTPADDERLIRAHNTLLDTETKDPVTRLAYPTCPHVRDYTLCDLIFRCLNIEGRPEWYMFMLFHDPQNKKAYLYRTDAMKPTILDPIS